MLNLKSKCLQDSLKSTATMVQSLTQELADGQRKLLSFAATEANPSAVSPQVPQLTIGPFCGSVEQVHHINKYSYSFLD